MGAPWEGMNIAVLGMRRRGVNINHTPGYVRKQLYTAGASMVPDITNTTNLVLAAPRAVGTRKYKEAQAKGLAILDLDTTVHAIRMGSLTMPDGVDPRSTSERRQQAKVAVAKSKAQLHAAIKAIASGTDAFVGV
ncbi:MAG: hypothetical protein K8D98_02185 [Rhodanobacter sp.]|nr:hypothetical protein [Rhodanobacter sp.]